MINTEQVLQTVFPVQYVGRAAEISCAKRVTSTTQCVVVDTAQGEDVYGPRLVEKSKMVCCIDYTVVPRSMCVYSYLQ